MRASVACVVVLAACASPAPEPEAASVAPAETRAPPASPFAALAKRLEGVDLEGLTAGWQRRDALPRPEGGYAVVLSSECPGMCDGWTYDVLVDIESPRTVWVRTSGTIAGIVEYRGPAELLGDEGPLAFRAGD